MTASIPSLDILFRSPLVQRAYLRHIGLHSIDIETVMAPADSEVTPMKIISGDVRTECSAPPDPDAVKREIEQLAARLRDRFYGDTLGELNDFGAYKRPSWIALATLAYELGARVR